MVEVQIKIYSATFAVQILLDELDDELHPAFSRHFTIPPSSAADSIPERRRPKAGMNQERQLLRSALHQIEIPSIQTV